MPALFIGHGSPMNALERNRYTDAWRALAVAIPRPAAVLSISAHWYIHETAVTGMAAPRTIHDFGGFPPELYAVQYAAAGAPRIAPRVQDLLAPRAIRIDADWGLDHGTWSVLTHLYPDADVPVLQLSIDASQSPRACYEIGQSLQPLRDAGVLIFGSGNVVHNLRAINWNHAAAPLPWAQQFEDELSSRLQNGDFGSLANYNALGAAARRSVPTPEHYLPLLYVLGTAYKDETCSIPIKGIELGSISMLCALVS